MCGIVGFISPKKQEDITQDMLAIQRYRGPDDHGVLTYQTGEKFIHLGHNRLAIQDLSPLGHQPFVSVCGEYVIVFNGEVYNFQTIRSELESLGVVFLSHSDTEVILYAYIKWGMDALEKFIGMFAIVILDKPQNKLILIRDRAGVKPLYYSIGEEFMFASELKSFHRHPSFVKKLNTEVLPYYFQFGYIPAPHTIYHNTYKLRPGEYLQYNLTDDTKELVKYWDVSKCYTAEKIDKSEAEIVGDLEQIIGDAVDLRMVSDVPVGVFLSGGYDSSLVVALLSKKYGKNLNTFTIGFHEKGYNEATHAKEIASYFGTNHTEYYVTQADMIERIGLLATHYDEPFGDSSALPTMVVSQLARKDVTVALSADGGDEHFGGYSKYRFLVKIAPLFRHSLAKKLLGGALGLMSPPSVAKLNSLLPSKIRQTNIEDKFLKFQRAIQSSSPKEAFVKASSYVDPSDIAQFLKISADKKLYENFNMRDDLDILDNMMLIDYRTFMVDDVLTKVDRATMHVSLEGREPLLDHRIIEYMGRVPTSLKYKNNQSKYLLRQVLYKYAPPSLIDKPKSGFAVPLAAWLQNELRGLVEHYLDPSKIDDELFDIATIERIKREFYAGDKRHSTTLWFLLSFQMWREKWF